MPLETISRELGSPLMTWNFYLTLILAPLCVFCLGTWLKIKAERYYKGWAQYNALREQNEIEFKKKIECGQACLKQAVLELKDKKADRMELAYDRNELWRRVNSHYHLIECGGESCDARKTGEVIIPHDNAT
jgi:hypothetical protein